MTKVDTFINIKHEDFYFNGCNSCEGQCCNGSNGIALSPLILDDFEEVYKNFTIIFGWYKKKVSVYMILNDGKGHCKYYINGKCSIYDSRAPACKLYPISPYFEHVLIDTACPSVNKEFGSKIVVDKNIEGSFYHKRLENFKEKREETQEFLESIKDINNFKFHTHIDGLALLRFNKPSDNKYIKMHLESLSHYKIPDPYSK